MFEDICSWEAVGITLEESSYCMAAKCGYWETLTDSLAIFVYCKEPNVVMSLMHFVVVKLQSSPR